MRLLPFGYSLARTVHVVWFSKAMLSRGLLLLISIQLAILYLVPLLLLITTTISQPTGDYLSVCQFGWIHTLIRSVAIGSWLHLVTSARHWRPLINFIKCAHGALVLPRGCSTLRCWIIHHLWVIMISRALLIVRIDGAKLSIRICQMLLWRRPLLRWALHIPASILFVVTWIHFFVYIYQEW